MPSSVTSTVSGCCCSSSSGIGDTCCPSIPATLHATITNVSGCSCLDGMVVTLTYNNGNWSNGPAIQTSCPNNAVLNIVLSCVGPGCNSFLLVFQCAGTSYNFPTSLNAGCTCSPFNLVFTATNSNPNVLACCIGTVTVTITT